MMQQTVLSDADRETILRARRWIRYVWQQGLHPQLDGIEHDLLFEVLQRLDAIHAAATGEPQLSKVGQGAQA